MLIFIFICVLVLSLSSFTSYQLRGEVASLNFRFLSIIFAFALSILVGLKDPLSWADSLTYLSRFYADDMTMFEPGFIFVSRLVSIVSSDGSLYFFIFGFISLTFLSLTVWNIQGHKSTLLLFIYLSHIYIYRDLIQIRAGISYNLVLLSYFVYHLKRESGKSFISILVAGLFHKTAFVALFSLCLGKLHISRKWFFLIITFGCLNMSLSLGSYLVDLVLNSGLLPSSLSVVVRTYLIDSDFVYKLNVFNPTTIKMLVFLLIFYSYRRFIDIFLFNTYVFAFVIITVFSDFAVFASRFASLFSMVELLIIPGLVYCDKIKSRDRILLFAFFTSVFVIIFLINVQKMKPYGMGILF